MDQFVQQLKSLETQKAIIDNEIKGLKIQRSYKQLSDSLRDHKLYLYNEMVKMGVDHIEGFELKKLRPFNEKKEIKKQEKFEKISKCLSDELDSEPDSVNSLAEKIAVL